MRTHIWRKPSGSVTPAVSAGTSPAERSSGRRKRSGSSGSTARSSRHWSSSRNAFTRKTPNAFNSSSNARPAMEGTTTASHRLLMPDGSVKHVHVVAHATKDDAGGLAFVGAVMDVTATKRAEEAMHQAQAELAHVTRVTTLGELAASIAHEVNQPLAAIVINGEACLRWLDREAAGPGRGRAAR